MKNIIITITMLAINATLFAQGNHVSPIIGKRLDKTIKDFQKYIPPTSSSNTSFKTDEIISLMDSSYHWNWDTVTKSFIVDQVVIYTYDADRNIASLQQKYWDNKTQSLTNRTIAYYTYDAKKM